MKVPELVVTVIPDSEGRTPAEVRGKLLAHLRRYAGAELDIVIRGHRSQRSLDQNRWIWGVAYPLLADSLGYDRDEIEDLHYALVEKWGGSHFDARMGTTVPNKRSSKLTTKEFSDFMEWLVRFAAKHCNCVIPLPDEEAA